MNYINNWHRYSGKRTERPHGSRPRTPQWIGLQKLCGAILSDSSEGPTALGSADWSVFIDQWPSATKQGHRELKLCVDPHLSVNTIYIGILVKTATLQNGHTQNGHNSFGYQNGHNQNGHTVLVKTATQGGSLPKRPNCIWSKRPQREDHYQNGHTAFGQNGHKGRITTKTATLHLVKTATQGGGSLDLLPGISHARGCACSHAAGPISLTTFSIVIKILYSLVVTDIRPLQQVNILLFYCLPC